MNFFKPGALTVFLGSILLLFPGSAPGFLKSPGIKIYQVSYTFSTGSVEVIRSSGYRAITRYKDGFVAAGSDGRIDLISVSGKIIKSETFSGEDFNSVVSNDKMIIAAGDNGILRISSDGELFRKADSGTDRNINSLAIFNRVIIGGADKGIIISGDPGGTFSEIHLDVRGNIVSVSARMSDCYGVTDEGEIIHSRDGISWDIFDFNKVYSGYYRACHFRKVLITDYQIVVTGIRDDGSPVMMFSNQGGVWTERILNFTDEQGGKDLLSQSPNDIIYDDASDTFFIACNNGRLMKLPSCSQCNTLTIFTGEDLKGISLNESTLMIIGSNYFIKPINIR